MMLKMKGIFINIVNKFLTKVYKNGFLVKILRITQNIENQLFINKKSSLSPVKRVPNISKKFTKNYSLF
ncbi:hypothetical protein C1H87_10125 [Flavivirga eckloniae]|uniref:Uncharacterized protein n=1 Tax=Flavivirga eckloniae TaxID=1803846 RepID=A0A2K9PPR3_9FLAO|nr:hypothetical protein C1H87_10125 [Flavivirga eckloniae]